MFHSKSYSDIHLFDIKRSFTFEYNFHKWWKPVESYHFDWGISPLWDIFIVMKCKTISKNMLKELLYKSDWRLCAILNQYFLTPAGQCIYCYCLSMMVSDVESPLNTAWYMIINPKHCLVEMVAVSDFEKGRAAFNLISFFRV